MRRLNGNSILLWSESDHYAPRKPKQPSLPQLPLHPLIRRLAGSLILIEPCLAPDGRDLIPARISYRLEFVLVDKR